MKIRSRIVTAATFLAACMALSGQAQAGVIDFEADATGNKANGFAAVGHPGITFTDTIGADLQVADFCCAQGDGRSLGVFGDDASRLQIDFDLGMDFLALDFGNDDPGFTQAGDRAWLEVYLGLALVDTIDVVMNRDDIMNQSISYSGAVIDRAVFWYGNAAGSPIGLIEIVDNIEYRVPEPGIIALMGMGLVAFGLTRRRRKA